MHPLLRLIALYRSHLALATVAMAGLALVNLAQPATAWLVGLAVEDARTGTAVVMLPQGGTDASVAWRWVWILVGVTVVRGLLQYGATIIAMILGQRLLHTLRDRILQAVQGLDLAWHRRHGAGEVINRTTRDADLVRDAVVGGTRSLFELAMVVVGTLGLLLWYHWLLAVVPTLLVLTAIAIMRRQAGRLVALDRAAAESFDAVSQELSEGVHGVRVIKAFALERERVGRFAGRLGGFTAKAREAIAYTAIRLPLPQLVVAAGHVWVLGCGGWLVAHGELVPGDLIAAMMVIQGLVFRVEAIGWLVRMFADASASAGRIMEILDARPAIAAGSGTAPPDGPIELRLDGVGVRIDGRAVPDGVGLHLR
ncbi:MAG: ABC transporter ATP-binding protein, partial [Planctomycetes bacterium]|nr:ABC transporter ATP-binding protein [Planctomycetota bacterium]